ncbi:LysR family transcriptional regulator [Tsuneonella suprasediminis]|uniref:LysR family transcriptional regulator n=1 Tax=Tsuneonella suprasediminis TaxID=2306996 RepID=A0A419R1W5_9SPHN|nr:LysR family transcriptional regulator [Tsuneonella suprasediminis]RJX67911.1 LysR family transcriptional regulator [Tsuneonella suprasediminis]
MVNSDDIRFFLILASEPTLAAGARRLDISPSAVTQRLRLIEQRLGLRLVTRSGRSLVLTDEGKLLAERGPPIVDDIDELVSDMQARRSNITGHLRVLAPPGFGRRYVAPLVASFGEGNPGIRVDLELSDKLGRHLDRRWDIAIHIGHLTDIGLTMRKLAPNRRILCAAPSYLAEHGAPETPGDLAGHRCLALRENEEDATLWRFSSSAGAISVRVTPFLATNDGEIVRRWALDGRGIIVRSEWDVADDIVSGRLVPLLEDYAIANADVVVLVGPAASRAGRTQAFLDYLAQAMSPPPWRGLNS